MIILDGKTATELGIKILKDYAEPSLPATVDTSIKIAGAHGERDGGAFLGKREFSIPMKIIPQSDEQTLYQKIDELKSILIDMYGRPRTFKLLFLKRPDRFYYARYSGSLPIGTLLTFANFTLPLVAFEPEALFVEDADEYTWGDDIPFLSDVPFEQSPYSYSITSPQTVTIQNFGFLALRPTIEITGSATSLIITANGKSISFGAFSNAAFTIDGQRYTVIKDGVNGLSLMTGNFIELLPGDNTISVGGSNLNIEMNFVFKPKYM